MTHTLLAFYLFKNPDVFYMRLKAVENTSIIALMIYVLLSLIGGWILYTCIEAPFLKFRDKDGKAKLTEQAITTNKLPEYLLN